MKNLKKILVPLDGSKNSQRGLDCAISVARQSQGTITGVFVMPIPPSAAFQPLRFSVEAMKKDTRKILESAKLRCAQNGVLFYSKILRGDPGNIIVKYAHGRKKFDMIIIGSRGRSGLNELFFGSTSNYVLHKSKIPVLVVK